MSPLARQLRLTNELRHLRGGVSIADAAKRAGIERTRYGKIEAGSQRATIEEVKKIAAAFTLETAPTGQLVSLARDAAQRGWWDEPDNGMGQRQRAFAALEHGAAKIRAYQSMTVHGLLQIEAFARERVKQSNVGDSGNGNERDEALTGRMTRRDLAMLADGPQLDIILEEHVVRRMGATSNVMREQLEYLGQLIDDQNNKVTIRVLPVDAVIADHVSPGFSFDLISYADPADPTVLIAEATATSEDPLWHSLAHPRHVAHYVAIFDKLSNAALPAEGTRSLINKALARLPDEPTTSP